MDGACPDDGGLGKERGSATGPLIPRWRGEARAGERCPIIVFLREGRLTPRLYMTRERPKRGDA